MTTSTQADKSRLQDLLGNADAWNTIDELVAMCDAAAFWSEEFSDTALEKAKKSHLRRLVRQMRDGDGWPVIASVETTNDDGETVRVYKQEMLFDIEDYRQVVTYHAERSDYHRRTAKKYAKRCEARFHTQLPLPFERPTKPR